MWVMAAALALAACGQDRPAAEPVPERASGSESPAAPTVAPTAAPMAAPAVAPAVAPVAAPVNVFPRYTEIQAHLRGSARGQRCFQNNVIAADLTESYLDADFDGDGTGERVFQTPDCLVVTTQREGRWQVAAMASRTVERDVEAVRLRSGNAGGRTVLEVTDLRGTQRTTTRWRFTGTTLDALP